MRRCAGVALGLAGLLAIPAVTGARPAPPRHTTATRHLVRAHIDRRVRRFALPSRPSASRPAAGGGAPSAGAAPPSAPPSAIVLPSRTGVLLDEWRVSPARNPVAAGRVELDATNSGEDAHDLTVARDGVVVAQTPTLQPGEAAVLTADLPAGDYKVYCSLLAGAHDQAGMHATLRVR